MQHWFNVCFNLNSIVVHLDRAYRALAISSCAAFGVKSEDLAKNLDGLESRGTQEMDCLVDLGSDVLAQAHV